jgi:Ca2+-binding RTX toxin-like protein
MSDDILVVTEGQRALDGGDGFDILDFGAFQARMGSTFNRMDESGGTAQLADPASGQAWSLDFVNVEGFQGSPYADLILGNARTTYISGGDGDDTLAAQVMDTSLPISLFGGAGADSLAGGEADDVLQGNAGEDVAHGWAGRDWLYGGQDGDALFGDDGDDHINGNLGADTVQGGAGADTVLGGQGDDSVAGGAGDDFLSGDKGADTLSGGAGADVFALAAGGGRDVVVDYSAAEGDVVTLAPESGAAYAAYQDGADAVIAYGGASLVLVGVQLAAVTVVGPGGVELG